MPDYARILEGAILDVRTFDDPPAQPEATHKGRWVPVVDVDPAAHDAATERLVPATTVEADQVVRGWTVEAIPLDEQRAAKHQAREAELQARLDAGYLVGGLHVQIDAGSRANLTALGTTAIGVAAGILPSWPADYARGWITVEGDRIPLPTPADGLTLAAGAGAYYAALVQHDTDIAVAIEASTDPQTVDVTAGWP